MSAAVARGQSKPVRRRNRKGWLTGDDSSSMSARVPNDVLRQVEARCREELISVADFFRRAVLNELRGDPMQSPFKIKLDVEEKHENNAPNRDQNTPRKRGKT